MEAKNLNRLKVVLAEKNRTNKWLAEQAYTLEDGSKMEEDTKNDA